MDTIPITSLRPETAPPADKWVQGIVSLSWPYSSSTRQCALLLADPDFRLRNKKGQVRVRFTGPSAEAIAKTRVGIGDEVYVRLDSAVWAQDSEATRTPGRSVDGELVFRRKLSLRIVKEQGDVKVEVDDPASPARSPERDVEAVTPKLKSLRGLQTGIGMATNALPSYIYSSPAFVKRLRLSGDSFFASSNDTFRDEQDDRTEVGRGQSFSRRIKWKYAEKSPSPVNETTAKQDVAPVGAASVPEVSAVVHETPVGKDGSQVATNGSAETVIVPPPLPRLDRSENSAQEDVDMLQEKGPVTPTLDPVRSPTLPAPSPPLEKSNGLFFGLQGTLSSPQTATEERLDNTGEDEDSLVAPLEQAPGKGIDTRDLDDPGDKAGVQGLSSRKLLPTAEGIGIVDDMERSSTEAELKQRRVSGDTIFALPQQLPTMNVADLKKDSMPHYMPGAEIRIKQQESSASLDFAPPTEKTRLETPIRLTSQVSSSAFGFDGATPDTPLQVTPQSERDRVMAQTFRSLFGFGMSPTASPVPRRETGIDMEGKKEAEPSQQNIASEVLESEEPASFGLCNVDAALGQLGQTMDLTSADAVANEHEQIPPTSTARTIPDELERSSAPAAAVAGRDQHQDSILHEEDLSHYVDVEDERNYVGGTDLRKPEEFYVYQEIPYGQPVRSSAAQQSPFPSLEGKSTSIEVVELDSSSSNDEATDIKPVREQEAVPSYTADNEMEVSNNDSTTTDLLDLVTEERLSSTQVPVSPAEQTHFTGMNDERFLVSAETNTDEMHNVSAPAEERQVDALPFLRPGALSTTFAPALFHTPDAEFDDALVQQSFMQAASELSSHIKTPLEEAHNHDALPMPTGDVPRQILSPGDIMVPTAFAPISSKETAHHEVEPDIPKTVTATDDTSPLRFSRDRLTPEHVPDDNEASDTKPGTLVEEIGLDSSSLSHSPQDVDTGELLDVGDRLEHAVVGEQSSTSVTSVKPENSLVEGARQSQPVEPTHSSVSPHSSVSADTVVADMLMDVDVGIQDQDFQDSQEASQRPLYPTLPLSPADSQKLLDSQIFLDSQDLLEASLPTSHELVNTTAASNGVPPTPQLTQVESFARVQSQSDSKAANSSEDAPSPKIKNAETQVNENATVKDKDHLVTESFSPKPEHSKPSRKSLSSRISNVPDVITDWFSPKRSSGVMIEHAEQHSLTLINGVRKSVSEVQNLQEFERQSPVHDVQVVQAEATAAFPNGNNGLITAHTYFTPLTKLEELVNASSQVSRPLDVIAVVTDSTRGPTRAKAGPRDYFTFFHISDTGLSVTDSKGVRVEVFRPWLATLPIAAVGDVVLLRGFSVGSRKRQAYLLSTDVSAWCVWRFDDSGAREEIKGPPVELGDQERERVRELRAWWQAVGASGQRADVPRASSEEGQEGPPAVAVTARL